jgi:hypothetical protein
MEGSISNKRAGGVYTASLPALIKNSRRDSSFDFSCSIGLLLIQFDVDKKENCDAFPHAGKKNNGTVLEIFIKQMRCHG